MSGGDLGTDGPPGGRTLRYRAPVPRVARLPARGRLIVGTDLQGNVRDFDRLVEIFEQARGEPQDAVLVLTGDLVHGPEIPEAYWPEYLGSYYVADSTSLVQKALALAARHPGRVWYLLGNHEHAHIGGPIVSKFFPNEALRLERLMGRELTRRVHEWLTTWPLVAIAPAAGLLLMHAAPNAVIGSVDDLEQVALRTGPTSPGMPGEEVLAEILWARTTTTARAHAFMRAIDPELRVVVFGHDVVREGYLVEREPLLCVSTSFGCFDGDKLYLDWDLAEPANSASEVSERGLRPLFPNATPIYRSVQR